MSPSKILCGGCGRELRACRQRENPCIRISNNGESLTCGCGAAAVKVRDYVPTCAEHSRSA